MKGVAQNFMQLPFLMIFMKNLLFCLIPLFVIWACDNPSLLGIQGESSLSVQYTDTFTLEAYTVWPDTTYSTNTSRALMGKLNVPGMVSISARSFSQIVGNISKDQISKPQGDSPIFVSAEVVLYYDYVNGDSTEKADLIVNQIDSPIYRIRYSIFQNLPIGKEVGRLKDYKFGSVNPSDLASYKSAIIPLDSLYAAAMFNRILAGTSLSDFQLDFKGLAFSSTHQNAIMGALVKTPISSIRFSYYRSSSDTVASLYFLGFNGGWQFNELKPDFSSSPSFSGFAIGDSVSSQSSGNQIFLQSGLGLAALVRVPYFHLWLKDTKPYINKAELVFDPVFDYDPGKIRPPSTVFFYQAGPERFVSRQPETDFYFGLAFESSSTVSLNVPYNASGRNFPNASMTLYFQDLISKRVPHAGFVMYPDQSGSEVSILPSVKLADPSHPDPKLKMKLRIYYTVNL
jgi:hypothetical protein